MSLRALVAVLLIVTPVGASTALAAEPAPPSDAALLTAKTVGVLPVLAVGESRELAYGRVAAMAARGEGRGIAPPGALVSLDTDGGFAFAGRSTSADVQLMQYGFLLGSLPTVSDDPAQLAQVVDKLVAGRDAMAPLAPGVVKAVDRFIASAKGGELDPAALGAALMGANEGIAAGPARAHGYFAAGVWFGLSLLAATMDEGGVDDAYLAMAGPLATMFEADAEFGGSDRTIARQLRSVARMLGGQGGVDATAFKAALMSAFTVGADVE
ncbi:MAG: hypothetical protein KC635_27460 [Myxococcales bacterium]|nr:hypothetical protein [Myxococcales bacterium]MCB9731676.1 hypothetical protein [Deltaproteobacteria bacterium]